MKPKIIVGLSGGVDSSVAAYLLKEQGCNVEAMFMQNWHDITGTLHGDCEWEEDRLVAQMVAKKLDIPFHFVDLSNEYRAQVVDYMFAEYAAGRTPNPDVLCNSKIKFDAFLQKALELGGDFVATGHYCQKEILRSESGEIYRILAGADNNKDQSYFLCQLSQKQLSKALFPIGALTKPQVREIARRAELPSAEKKDSQGICFVGKVDLPLFLQQKIKPVEGEVVEIFEKDYPAIRERELQKILRCAQNDSCCVQNESCCAQNESCCAQNDELEILSAPIRYNKADGKVIGKHIGVPYYTIGQRHGLNIGGHAGSIFIIATDTTTNTIYVGEGKEHSGLFRKGLKISYQEQHWIREDLKMECGESREYLVRIRYRQPLQKATLYSTSNGLYIIFNEPQRGITPGQFAVWYTPDGEMIGSGPISS
ncbi:MAG: tRNA 2-thiouridine(34) synthase MnmA [Bacteroidales bacterium]|nr:tRNA 2-thiouridine(34) synthase MnmA [Bacteroidales bacterium]